MDVGFWPKADMTACLDDCAYPEADIDWVDLKNVIYLLVEIAAPQKSRGLREGTWSSSLPLQLICGCVRSVASKYFLA